MFIVSDKLTYYYFMKIKEKYYELRDNLAIGIANMAKIYDSKISENKGQFEDVFEYTMMQLEEFDCLWDKIIK